MSGTADHGGRSALADRLARVRAGVRDALRAAERVDEPALIVVTKFQPASLVRELADLGVTDVGESRHQEARVKSAELDDRDLTWHFVGQLQSKKARQARSYARVVHSVDRVSLVDALAGDRATDDEPVDVFVQVDLEGSPERGGVPEAEVERMAELVLARPSLRLLGVMAVAPRGEEPRAAFARLRAASDAVRALAPSAVSISAGMSDDYRDALLEGATHLRIGTAITGSRPPAL